MERNEKAPTAASKLDPHERLRTAAIGMASNIKLHATGSGGEKGTAETVDIEHVRKMIADWSMMSKNAAEQTIKAYGPPNETTPSQLIWYANGPWKRTIVYRDEIPHDFPQPHSDVIEQVITYQVPPEKFSEIAKFDGSVVIERTKGEVSARCDMEAANILALNMMHEIVAGRKTADEARKFYTEQTAAYVMNKPAPWAEQFQFDYATEEQFDPDKTTMQDVAISEALQKIKGTFGLND